LGVTVRTSIDIDRPPEHVWAYFDDHRHDLAWRHPSLKRLERIGDGPVGPGTRYEGVIGFAGKDYPYVSEVTEYKPPTRVAWRGVSSAGWLIGSEGSYTLESSQGATRLTHEITLNPNKFGGKLVMPLISAMGPKRRQGLVMPLLKQLKEELEKR
jgi:uncharacterized protein YndB with AHSA1/START domain